MKKKWKNLLVALLSLTAVACVATACQDDSSSDSNLPQERVELAITTPTLTIGVGETLGLEIQTVFEETPVWFSSDETVATVSNGQVTAIKAGECEISVVCNGRVDVCQVTVLADAYDITFNASSVLLSLQKSFTVIPTMTYNNEAVTGAIATWSVEDESIATVDNGTIKGIAYGETYVNLTMSYANKTLQRKIFVTVKSTVEAFLSESQFSLPACDESGNPTTKALTCTIKDNGTAVTGASITWESLNPTVATVDTNGVVTTSSVGTAIIVANCEFNGVEYTVSSQVSVEYATVEIAQKVDVELARSTVITLPMIKNDTIKEVKVGEKTVGFTQAGEKLTLIANNMTAGVDSQITVQGERTIHTGNCFISTMAIASADDFKTMRGLVKTGDDYYYLKNDIDFNGTDVSGNATFMGTFDGKGFAIKNFSIKWVATYNSGLFGNVVQGTASKYTTIKNFSLLNVTQGADKSGAIANEIKWYTNVENVFIEANLTRGSSAVGTTNYKAMSGIICSNATAFTYFRNCVVIDKAPSSILRSGGLGVFIGYGLSALPQFFNCYAVSVAERPLVLTYDVNSYQGSGVTLASGFKDGTPDTAFTSVDALKTHWSNNAGAVEKLEMLSEKTDGIYWGSVKVI